MSSRKVSAGSRKARADEESAAAAPAPAPTQVSAAPSPTPAPVVKREFQDHMSAEGQTSSIPLIIRIMYVVLLAYSYLVSLVTGDHALTQFCFYFVIIILFYMWHWLAHQNFMGRMHQIHWRHHFTTFPPKKFYGDPGTCQREYGHECPTLWQLMDPRASTNFTVWHEGILYFLLFIALALEHYALGYSWLTVAFSLLMSAVIGSVGSALHSSFHVRGFAFEKYQWYLELRALHYIHHLGSTQHNFGVFNIGLVDGVMNSIRLTDPVQKTEEQVALPDRLSSHHVLAAHGTSGNAGRLLLFSSVHHEKELRQLERMSAVKRGYPTVLLRFVLVGFGVWFWQMGQQWIRSYSAAPHVVNISLGDLGFSFVAPLRNYIVAADLAPLLHNIQLSLTDLTVFIIAAIAIFGRTVRGALTVVLACLIRSAAQTLTPFVAVPAGILLPKLSVPTFLGNVPSHEVSFFCPHIVAVVALFLECSTHRSLSSALGRLGAVVAAALVLFQLAAALVLHVAWSVDILVAVFIAVLAHRFARKLASSLDGMKSL